MNSDNVAYKLTTYASLWDSDEGKIVSRQATKEVFYRSYDQARRDQKAGDIIERVENFEGLCVDAMQ